MGLLGDWSEPEGEPIIGPAATPLELLQAIYRSPAQPLARRMRAAIAALPFEHPKLAVVASFDAGPGFAAKLEAAIIRTRELREPGEIGYVAVSPQSPETPGE